MVATQLDLRGEHLVVSPRQRRNLAEGYDLIIVPPMPIKVFDNIVKLVFTDGIYVSYRSVASASPSSSKTEPTKSAFAPAKAKHAIKSSQLLAGPTYTSYKSM